MSFMNTFRKNQKALMAGLVVVAMISFIAFGTANFGDSNSRRNGPIEVIAKTSNGDINSEQLEKIVLGRVILNQFRQGVAARAAQAAGQTNRGTFTYSTSDELELVRSEMAAEEGRRMGISIPDSQVDAYIRAISGNDMVTTNQIAEIVRSIRFHDRGVNFGQIKEAIRRELLVNETIARISPRGEFDYAATPEQRWEYFCRLERSMKLQVHAVPVADFITNDKIPDPSPATLEAFYEANKNTIPSNGSPAIGFKRPERVKLEYLKADWVKFVDMAKAKLTDAEIRAEFDLRKVQLRQTLELMEDMIPPADEPEDKTGDKGVAASTDKPADAKPDAEKSDAEKKDGEKKPEEKKPEPKAVIKATEPGPTPYEEAVGLFATKAPRATEPRFTDDEILARNREGIVKSLSERAARTQMTKALDQAYQRMIAFYEQSYRPWLAANKGKDTDKQSPPPKFNVAQFANPDSGLTYHQTSDLSFENMLEDKYFSRTWVNRKWGKQVNRVTQVEEDQITADGTNLLRHLFATKNVMSPFRGEDDVSGTGGSSYRNQYVMWATEYQNEQTPEFASIQDEVKKAWKMANSTGTSARELAMKRAQAIADDVNGAGKTLKEQFPSANDVIETDEFTWFDTHKLPLDGFNEGALHFAPPTLHRVEQLEGTYLEFCRATLRLKNKEAAAIMNDAGTIVYVVQVFDGPFSSEEILRERFVREPFTKIMPFRQYGIDRENEQGYVLASQRDMELRSMKWWSNFEKQHALDWTRPARRGRDE